MSLKLVVLKDSKEKWTGFNINFQNSMGPVGPPPTNKYHLKSPRKLGLKGNPQETTRLMHS